MLAAYGVCVCVCVCDPVQAALSCVCVCQTVTEGLRGARDFIERHKVNFTNHQRGAPLDPAASC